MQKEKLVRGFLYTLLIFFILTFLTLVIKEVPFAHGLFQTFEKKSLDTREVILSNVFFKNSK